MNAKLYLVFEQERLKAQEEVKKTQEEYKKAKDGGDHDSMNWAHDNVELKKAVLEAWQTAVNYLYLKG